MCDVDYEPCEVWNETTRKARKTHRCSSCGAQIQPGANYVVHFSVFEGSTTSEKICDACQDGRSEFLREHGSMPIPSGFPAALEDCIDDGDAESELKWKPMLAALRSRRDARSAK